MAQSAFPPVPTHASDYFPTINVVVSSRVKECPQMQSSCVPATEKSSGTIVSRMLVATMAALVLFGICSTMAFGQCTLGGPLSSWNAGTGNWGDGGNWTGGVPN